MNDARTSLYDQAAVERFRRQWRLDPHRLRRLRTTLLKQGAADEAALAELPPTVCEAFLRQVELHALALHRRWDSAQDGATKLLFRTSRGLLIESVMLRIASGRTSLCVSSQVGCAAACEFCATGRMGIAQNLSAAEILDQLVQANQLLAGEGRRVRNLVFMGMGEPFHNEAQLYETLDKLLAADFFHHPASRILVSTV